MFLFSNCQRIFSSSRGLSIHCYKCNNDNNNTTIPSSSTTMSQVNSTKHYSTNKMPVNDILQNISSTKKNKKHNSEHEIAKPIKN